MRAIQITDYGGAERLALADVPVPEPGAGEVQVEIAYAGINFIDIYQREGVYKNIKTYPNTLPFTLGMEGSGRVNALGPGVVDFTVGDRVAYCLSLGSYAEVATVPTGRLVAVPDDVPLNVAAALMLQGSTAHYLSHSLFPLQDGQTCLVHAGAGGVGRLLIQMARLRGARVMATVGTPEKADIASRLGADPAIQYRDVDFAEAVRAATDGAGVDVVYDSVGEATIEGSLRCLKRLGVLALFGGSSGSVKSVSPLALAEAGSVFLTRPHLADYIPDADTLRRRTADLFAMHGAGRLEVAIDEEIPLADAARAHRTIEDRRTTGKLLLAVGGGT